MSAAESASTGTVAGVTIAPTCIQIGQADSGPIVRIEGRGTMRQSASVNEFIGRVLSAEVGQVVIDLSGCNYLDSTFLGCLLRLHKRFGASKPPRFCVAAPQTLARKLLGSTCLDRILQVVPSAPPINGVWHELHAESQESREVARHVLACHRELASIEGPAQSAFRRIAEQMERELGG